MILAKQAGLAAILSGVLLHAMPASAQSGVIQAYLVDVVPIYDESGVKLRDVPASALPAANTPGAAVLAVKDGYVAIQAGGAVIWLRRKNVDYSSALPICLAAAIPAHKGEVVGAEKGLGESCHIGSAARQNPSSTPAN